MCDYPETYSDELIEAIEADHYPVAAVAAWSTYTGYPVTEWDRPTREAFEDAYNGEHRSEEDFAQELADDLGVIPSEYSWPTSCIDWEQAARELFMGDYFSTDCPTGGVYVFRSI